MNSISMFDIYFPTILQYYILWRNTFITWPREIPLQMIDGKASNLCTCKYKGCAPLECFISKLIRPPCILFLSNIDKSKYHYLYCEPNGKDNWQVVKDIRNSIYFIFPWQPNMPIIFPTDVSSVYLAWRI